MSKKRILALFLILLLLIIIVFVIFKFKKSSTDDIIISVKKGQFEISVTTTGELQALNSEKILGPSIRRAGIYNDIKINDIIPEGTVVDSGDYVATLDKSDVLTKLKQIESKLQEIEAQYIQKKLDTTLNLRGARDELINLKFNVEEKKITYEQSKYEPLATIRQYKIELEKSERAYNQSLSNYILKKKKAEAIITEVFASLNQQEYVRDNLLELIEEFKIKAPKAGMLIYRKSWRGRKIKAGSTISPWNPVVGELPDLSVMISKTFINEIDIRKIKVGQQVIVGVDAFPDKKYSGVVKEIANIGEQLPNSNAKVFEVIIQLNEYDSILRPAMTTSNKIITDTFNNVVSIPLEALNTSDSLIYIYKQSALKIVKQIAKTGKSNENEIIIIEGIKEGDKVLLTVPENEEKLNFVELDSKKEVSSKAKKSSLNKK
ncbi:MAG: HlyD family secretion protein [Bacteroidota bacterium]|nr:HlyD family secretion protein [Bacteroidota bacterium]